VTVTVNHIHGTKYCIWYSLPFIFMAQLVVIWDHRFPVLPLYLHV